MDNKLVQLGQLFERFTSEEYVYGAIGIVAIWYLFYWYAQNVASRQLEKQLNLHKRASDLSADGQCILSERNEVQHINMAMRTLLDLDKKENITTINKSIEIKIKREWQDFNTFITQHAKKTKKVLFTGSFLRIFERKEIPVNVQLERVQTSDKVCQYIISIEDLSEKIEIKKSLFNHQITGLPNQLQSMKDLPALYSKIHLEKNKIALALMSFDNFVMLRSIVGYEESTEILKKFAKYLENVTKELSICVYHTFDNHFLITMQNIDSEDEVVKLIEMLQIKLAESKLPLSLSAGIAVYPDSGSTRELLDNTYKALIEAEKVGEGRVHIFLPESSEYSYSSFDLHKDMKESLDKGEFEVYYQPIVDAHTEEVLSAEALIRWIHPKHGIISPDIFIHLMEKTGFIVNLGRFVLESVLRQQKRWEIFGFRRIDVAINVSMVEISTGEFVQYAMEQVKYHNLYPECIKFEITEGVAMMDEKQTSRYFHDLKRAGFKLSLDDFGTGYTSFTYLKKFPADFLKIDKSLVEFILENKEDQRIVKAMIELGHTLGMKVIIEGIETKEMAVMLRTFGSDYFQGYYFAKPLQVFEFQKLLR
jgi:polar amino acid transport system substrate-binding protein